jgi:hypothetical protein
MYVSCSSVLQFHLPLPLANSIRDSLIDALRMPDTVDVNGTDSYLL